MAAQIEVEAVNLVLVGHFNPAIFTPHWFSRNGLIEEEDAEAADVAIIHPQVASFTTSWFSIVANSERIQLEPVGAIGIPTFDLMWRMFVETLPHTPIRAFGINNLVHFRVDNQEVLNRVGDLLAPKEPWGPWGEELMEKSKSNAFSGMKQFAGARAGGLVGIVMLQTERPDGRAGHFQVKLEPSIRYSPGLYIESNDHFKANDSEDAAEFLSGLKDVYDASITRSRQIVEHFMHISDGL